MAVEDAGAMVIEAAVDDTVVADAAAEGVAAGATEAAAEGTGVAMTEAMAGGAGAVTTEAVVEGAGATEAVADGAGATPATAEGASALSLVHSRSNCAFCSAKSCASRGGRAWWKNS